jgi:hypothetical protein
MLRIEFIRQLFQTNSQPYIERQRAIEAEERPRVLPEIDGIGFCLTVNRHGRLSGTWCERAPEYWPSWLALGCVARNAPRGVVAIEWRGTAR